MGRSPDDSERRRGGRRVLPGRRTPRVPVRAGGGEVHRGGARGKEPPLERRAAREAEETKRSWFFPGWKKAFSVVSRVAARRVRRRLRRARRGPAALRGGWSEPSSARRRRVGTGGAGTKAGHDENTGRMRLDDDDARGDDDDAESNARTFSYPRAPFARGVVAVTLVSSATSVGVLCVSAVARVVDRAGKGGVGYSRRDATFLGETAREIRFAVAKSTRRKRARLESSFAVAQTVLMETFASLAEMRLGRGAVAFAAGARKIEKSAELASLAQFCVLSHHLVESAERVARFLEHRAIAGTEGENNRLSSLASTQTACLPPVTALVAASLVTLALLARAAAVRRARARGERGVPPPFARRHRRVRARVFVVAVICHRRVLTPAGRDARRRARPKRLACWACTGVVLRAWAAASGRACDARSRPARSTGPRGRATTRTTRTTRTEPASTATRSPRARATDRRRRRARARGKRRAARVGGALATAPYGVGVSRGGRARVYELGTDPEFDGTLGTLLPLAQLALAVPLAAGYGVGAHGARRRRSWRSRRFRVSGFERARARAHDGDRRGVRGGTARCCARWGGETRADARVASMKRASNTCARARRERRGRRGARSRLSSKPEKHGLSHSSSGRLIRRVTFSVNAEDACACCRSTTRRAW